MRRTGAIVTGVAAAAGLLLSACGGAVTGRVPSPAGRPSGTVRFAGYVGEGPTFLFPLYPGAYWDVGYVPWFSYLMWQPLYLWGAGGSPVFNAQRSMAEPPVFSVNSAGHTVATITLKPWRWSDGRPITTRDVQFWMNLVRAEKENWAPYIPGKFPDNVSQLRVLSARTFQVVFNAHYSTVWLLGNELSQITPIPQHAWDRTSKSGPVGNHDLTPAGARSVYTYLMAQAKSVTTYATNPLWKVVSGAWEISQYSPTTSYAAFKPNPDFSGPDKPRIRRFVEVPVTSDASEFDALESGTIDYGYVPLNDLSTIPQLERKGYRIAYWKQDSWGGIVFNYAPKDPQTPILHQLYVRQAMTHLINMKAILQVFEHGHGYYTAGPVPYPPLATAQERRDPYPYSVRAARSLLTAHGWHVVPNGVSTCRHPGTGPGECGAGIAKGAALQFSFDTNESTPLNSEITQMVKSNFTAIGVGLTVRSEPISTEIAGASACEGQKTCPWQIMYWMGVWPLGWTTWYPATSAPFGCGSVSNYLNWCDPTTQRLIAAVHANPAALAAFEAYMAKEQPLIFLPTPVFRVSAIRDTLKGATPQDPFLSIYPQDWHYAG